jgi:hypothetical protein
LDSFIKFSTGITKKYIHDFENFELSYLISFCFKILSESILELFVLDFVKDLLSNTNIHYSIFIFYRERNFDMLK